MSSPEVDKRRQLGLTTAVCLVVANMIGVGVFTTSGFSLGALGSPGWVMAAWGIGGLLALLGATSYGALSARISESGGEYLFLSRTVHPLVGFLGGWVSLLAGFTAPIAAAALGLQAYLAVVVPDLPDPRWLGTGAILLAGALHGLHVRTGAGTQNTFVVIKLLLLALFIVYGLTRLAGTALPDDPAAPGFTVGVFAVQLMYISFSYSGWNAAVYVAGEVRDPKRNLPRALVNGTLLVTVLYLLLNALFVYSAPMEQLANKADIGAVAAEALGGTALANFVRIIIAVALFTSVSSMVMAGPRVYAKMADDGVFPKMFAFTAEVPLAAILLQVGLAIVVLWNATLQELLGYIGFTLAMSTAVAVIGLVVLREREGSERVPIPGYPWIPAAFVLGTLAIGVLMISTGVSAPLYGLATMALGILAYYVLKRPTPTGTAGS